MRKSIVPRGSISSCSRRRFEFSVLLSRYVRIDIRRDRESIGVHVITLRVIDVCSGRYLLFLLSREL